MNIPLIDYLQVNFELHDNKDGQDSTAVDTSTSKDTDTGGNRGDKGQDDGQKTDDRKRSEKKKKEGGDKKKKLEPSLKWKKLEVEQDSEEYVENCIMLRFKTNMSQIVSQFRSEHDHDSVILRKMMSKILKLFIYFYFPIHCM